MYELVKTCIIQNLFIENIVNIVKLICYTRIEKVKLLVTASI